MFTHQLALRRASGRRELIVILLTLTPVAVVLSPACQLARETHGRHSSCLNKLRQHAFACLNYENSHRRFPHFTTQGTLTPDMMTVGDATQAPAVPSGGYSWMAYALLPNIEEELLHTDIKNASEDYILAPFSSTMVSTYPRVMEVDLPFLHCPNYSGPRSSSAPEYAALGVQPATTNYFAFAGTHMQNGKLVENGVIVSPLAVPGGVSIGMISDGTSKTLLACESREADYAAWYDGTTAWVLPFADGTVPTNDDLGHPTMPPRSTTLNVQSAGKAAMLKAVFGGKWGPSSEHPGSVMHTFVDGHTQAISDDIDPTLYYRIITRSGSEPFDPERL